MILYIINSFCEQLSVNVFPIHAHAVTRLSMCVEDMHLCAAVSPSASCRWNKNSHVVCSLALLFSWLNTVLEVDIH